jgi:NADH-quinone oxidoreductase subunit H
METTAIIIIIINVILAVKLAVGTTPIMVWWERRIAGFMQDRTGPNRCHIGGFRLGGLIQSIADMLKLVFKEEFIPSYIKNKFMYQAAPSLLFICAFLCFAVVPFADTLVIDGKEYMMQAIPMDLGILWFLAFAGLSIYGIMLGGYASDSKYSLLSAIRASAQVISYEAAMGLSLISVLIVYGTVNLNTIASMQGELLFGFLPAWGILMQPLAFLIFVVTALAETNRAPFDIAEGESEIVAGYHTEYSAMKFGLFQVGEFAAMSASSAIIVTLFLGGYQIPWLSTEGLKENITTIMMILVLVLPIFMFVFTNWIRKNNQWEDENDPRAKESKVLIRTFWTIIALIVGALLFLLSSGLTSNGVNIATAVVQISTFMAKFFFVNFVFIWIRWTLLRFRYDQLQLLGWKVLLPLALLNIFITATFVVVRG